jgi:hypothetical protein
MEPEKVLRSSDWLETRPDRSGNPETRDFTISPEELNRAAATFTGSILQKPPRVSALKRNGRRFYEMARSGESFEPDARSVTIHEFVITAFNAPDVEFSRCRGHVRVCGQTGSSWLRWLPEGAPVNEGGQFAVEGRSPRSPRSRWERACCGAGAGGRTTACAPGRSPGFSSGFFLGTGPLVSDGRSPGMEDFEAITSAVKAAT